MPEQIPLHVHQEELDDGTIDLIVHVEHWPQSIRIDGDLLRWEHPTKLLHVGDCLELTVDNGAAAYLLTTRDERHLDWWDATLKSSRLDRSTL